MNAMMIVVVNMMVDDFEQFAKLLFKTSQKGFAVTILPWRSDIANRDLYAVLFEVIGTALRHKFVALIGAKDSEFCTNRDLVGW